MSIICRAPSMLGGASCASAWIRRVAEVDGGGVHQREHEPGERQAWAPDPDRTCGLEYRIDANARGTRFDELSPHHGHAARAGRLPVGSPSRRSASLAAVPARRDVRGARSARSRRSRLGASRGAWRPAVRDRVPRADRRRRRALLDGRRGRRRRREARAAPPARLRATTMRADDGGRKVRGKWEEIKPAERGAKASGASRRKTLLGGVPADAARRCCGAWRHRQRGRQRSASTGSRAADVVAARSRRRFAELRDELVEPIQADRIRASGAREPRKCGDLLFAIAKPVAQAGCRA